MLNNFNIDQINKIKEIFLKNQTAFIGSMLGTEYLTDYEKYLLKEYGINLDDLNVKDYIEEMFFFGIYSQILGKNNSFKVKKKNFDKWYKNQKSKNLSIQKQGALIYLKNRAYTDISGLGNKMQNKLSNNIINNSTKNLINVKKIGKEIISNNKNSQSFASILGELTEDWSKDFSRVADYILQDCYGYGRLSQIIDSYGEDVLVYKQTFPGVCSQCEKNYGTPGEKPVIYTIQELMSNGNNIGRSEQLPVIGQAHPWARSILKPVPPNSEWDDKTKEFIIKRNNYNVNRNSKVKINISN